MSEYVFNAGNMASFMDRLGVTGARDANNVFVPLKMYMLEGMHFSSLPRLPLNNNQQVELYAILERAFALGLIANPSYNYFTDVDYLRVQATTEAVVASFTSETINITVPIKSKLQKIILVGNSSLLETTGDKNLNIKITYEWDNTYNLDYTTLGLPTSIMSWDLSLISLESTNTITEDYSISELSNVEIPRKIILGANNVIQLQFKNLISYSLWGLSIELPY